jgi:hypothetical protein
MIMGGECSTCLGDKKSVTALVGEPDCRGLVWRPAINVGLRMMLKSVLIEEAECFMRLWIKSKKFR